MGFIQDKNAKIFIAGHRGMVGGSLVRKLKSLGFQNLLLKSHKELDLTQQQATQDFFKNEKPDYVFLAAARVGGIKANSDHKAEFLYENLMIQCNVIQSAVDVQVKKFLFLGSSCIYPRLAPQPMKEESLLTSSLESTNEGYAIAKIAGLKLCQYLHESKNLPFISAMPTNLYGPEDTFDPEKSHVIPAMIYKLHKAKIENKPFVELWGTGTPRREFLFVDDLAEALIFLMENYDSSQTINIGSGEDLTIQSLAELIKVTVEYPGEIKFNSNYPDGPPRKLLDVSRLVSQGWKAHTPLKTGIKNAYAWALENKKL